MGMIPHRGITQSRNWASREQKWCDYSQNIPKKGVRARCTPKQTKFATPFFGEFLLLVSRYEMVNIPRPLTFESGDLQIN